MSAVHLDEAEKAQIWVVDDDRSIRWVLEKALSRANLPSRVFATAGEVLEALKSGKPELCGAEDRPICEALIGGAKACDAPKEFLLESYCNKKG